jgi:hypothetical protein
LRYRGDAERLDRLDAKFADPMAFGIGCMARHVDPQFGTGICIRAPEPSDQRDYVTEISTALLRLDFAPRPKRLHNPIPSHGLNPAKLSRSHCMRRAFSWVRFYARRMAASLAAGTEIQIRRNTGGRTGSSW